MRTRFEKCTALIVLIATIISALTFLPFSEAKAEETTRFYDWKQYDPKWKDVYIGSNTIGNIGCYATSAAMLVVYSGLATEENLNPEIFVKKLKAVGGFAGNLIYKGKIDRAFPGFVYESEVLLGNTIDEKTESIAYYLKQGYYIIAGVKNLGHYVAIREVKNGIVYMMDPAAEETVLFNRYASSGVTKIFLYTSTGKKVDISGDFSDNTDSSEGSGSFESSEDTGEFKKGIYKTDERLNLRKSATTSSDSLNIVPAGTELEITSVSGSWGKTTYNGITGYIYLVYATYISEGTIKDPNDNTSEEPSAEPSSEESSFEEPSIEPSSEESSYDVPSSEEPSSEESSEESSAQPSDYVPGTYITTGALNLREGPTTSTPVLTSIPKGTTIEVTEVNGKWGKTTYNGKTGYCGLSYTKLVTPAAKPIDVTFITSGTNGQTVAPSTDTYKKGLYKTTANLRLRSGAGTSYTSLCIIPIGSELKITEVKNGWGKTVYDGQEGWCSLEYASFTNPYLISTEISANKIVANIGEEADLSSVCINYTYSDGSVYTVRSDITISYTIPIAPGTVKATALHNDATYTFEILYVNDCSVKLLGGETYVVTNVGASSESIFGCSSVEIKTGSFVKLDSTSFVVVVIGDVDGSGDITATDYVVIKQTFLGIVILDGAKAFAADVDGDGEITSTDYLSLKYSFLK